MKERIILLKQGYFKSIDSLNPSRYYQTHFNYQFFLKNTYTYLYQAIEQANNQFITLKTHRLSTKDLKHLYIEVNLIYNKKKLNSFLLDILAASCLLRGLTFA